MFNKLFNRKAVLLVSGLMLFLSSCSALKKSKNTVYKTNVTATFYHDKFNGKRTASGEKFHNSRMTAAHRTLPFGTIVQVTNRNNKKFVQVKINDRGPFSKGKEIDLSKKAFKELGESTKVGVIQVDLEIVK